MSKPNKIATLEEALAIIAEKESETAELIAIQKDLRTELAKAKKIVSEKENIVEYKGKKYKVNCKSFHFYGAVHDASTLADNKEVLAELINSNVGFLVEVK